MSARRPDGRNPPPHGVSSAGLREGGGETLGTDRPGARGPSSVSVIRQRHGCRVARWQPPLPPREEDLQIRTRRLVGKDGGAAAVMESIPAMLGQDRAKILLGNGAVRTLSRHCEGSPLSASSREIRPDRFGGRKRSSSLRRARWLGCYEVSGGSSHGSTFRRGALAALVLMVRRRLQHSIPSAIAILPSSASARIAVGSACRHSGQAPSTRIPASRSARSVSSPVESCLPGHRRVRELEPRPVVRLSPDRSCGFRRRRRQRLFMETDKAPRGYNSG